MADRFLIAPYDKSSGLRSDLKPWLIPDEAFASLENAYVFRGRVRKRFGSRWFNNNPLLSRLRIQVGQVGAITPTTSAGILFDSLADTGFPLSVGQGFSISYMGTDLFFTIVNPNTGDNQMLRTDGLTDVATFNIADSIWEIHAIPFPDGTPVYFYPGLPVMGLLTYETNTAGNDTLVGFDTKYAYIYSNGWDRLAGETNAGDAVWTGTDYQFFWNTTWSGVNASTRLFFVTNFNQNEPNFMRYFDGTNWTTFKPAIDASNFLISSQILVVFKNRLIALNTWEGASSMAANNYTNRCRYAQIGDPTSDDAWRSDMFKGVNTNAIDAATLESIVSCEFIKDRLIVYFERSAWELVYTGNQAYPFTWQKINTELGAESPFSTIPFDTVVLGVSQVGIHACNGSNVERIDDSIPDEVFEVDTLNNGVIRVYGIRDYFVEQAYWTFPDSTTGPDAPYPNRVLVFNYKTGTWGLNDDTITCFGYYQPVTGVLWSDLTVFWNSDTPWSSGLIQSQSRQVVGGNQTGFTFFIDADSPTNALVLPITNITFADTLQLTVISHNLAVGDYILVNDCNWSDDSIALNGTIFQVVIIVDANNFLIAPLNIDQAPTGTYTGGGLCGRVSKLNITTKEYNFYTKDNRNIFMQKADFMVTTTPGGQMTVNYFSSTSTDPLLQEGLSGNVVTGTGNLDTFAYSALNKAFGFPIAVPIEIEANSTRVWHPVYLFGEGEVVQLQLTMNDEQMRNLAVAESTFELHAMIITAMPTSSRLQ